MGESSRLSVAARLTICVGVAIAAALAVLATPRTVAAHVNRTVGPYTILVVLIEEPYYATNHAGFEFWVSDVNGYVDGLDKSLTATATDGSHSVSLVLSPQTDRRSYLIDHDAAMAPFDPGRGGAWTLELQGQIRGLPIDESFATTFPAYPRVASGRPAQAAPPVPADSTTPLLPIGGLIVAVIAVVRVIRGNMSQRHPAPT